MKSVIILATALLWTANVAQAQEAAEHAGVEIETTALTREAADESFDAGEAFVGEGNWINAVVQFNIAQYIYGELGLSDQQAISKGLRGYYWDFLSSQHKWELLLYIQRYSIPMDRYWDTDFDDGTRLIALTQTQYIPRRWIENAITGTLEISYDIGPDGHTTNIQTISSDLGPSIAERYIESIRNWRFASDDPDTTLAEIRDRRFIVQLVDGSPVAEVPSEFVRPLVRYEPNFPTAAFRRGIRSAVTVLKFDLREDGSVENIEVIYASTPRIYDGVSRRAVRRWRYEALADSDGIGSRTGLTTVLTFRMAD